MDKNNSSSIYNLITELCEKFASNRDIVGKLRTMVFEILLKKRSTITPEAPFKDIKGPDVFSNVLAWQFILAHKYGMVDYAGNLKDYAEYVQECYGDALVQFVMCLRNVPNNNDENFELEFLDGFKKCSPSTAAVKEEPVSPCSSLDIWELALKETFNPRKNWENFGKPQPDKEKSFTSELADSTVWVESLPSLFSNSQQILVVKSVSEFVKDVKYLLVGIASYSFSYDEKGDFHMTPDITVKGLTPDILQSFSKDFIFCGACYKALNNISTPNSATGEYTQEGYIFKELCESIRRYLEFYRTSVLRLPNTFGLLKLHERTEQLRRQLTILSEIFKLGPYSDSTDAIPHGVSLLNYLYQSVLNLTDKNVLLVLYSILFPCCQVYFNRFLQQWLLEGTVNDPYEEFFIKPDYKYVSTRGRTYWTRSFVLREDRVPDFLLDQTKKIMHCGKTMNLLKTCFPSSKLCLFLSGEKPPIVTCCLTSEQLSVLEQNVTNYYLEVSAECGPRMDLERVVRRRQEQDPIFMTLVAKKRAATLKRIELERKKLNQEEKEKKMEELAGLKEQYDSAMVQKQLQIASEIVTEMKQIEYSLSVESLRDKLIEREAQNLIDYYNDLYEISEKRKKKIDRHIEILKSVLLDPSETVNDDFNSSSEESFHSVVSLHDDDGDDDEGENPIGETQSFHTSESLDVINANADNEVGTQPKVTRSLETFELARKIKAKVLEEELGIVTTTTTKTSAPLIRPPEPENLEHLTDAQRNKLKVLSCEFAMGPSIIIKKPSEKLNQMEINRNFMMASSDCFYGNEPVKTDKLDNSNYLNRNNAVEPLDNLKKSVSLSMEINKFELDRPVPMSVDSTPLSDLPLTPATSGVSIAKTEWESACTNTDEGFVLEDGKDFAMDKTDIPRDNPSKLGLFSKRVSFEEASGLSTNCLKLFLYESISLPLARQTELANNELLKYLVEDLQYFRHLSNLRDYFFLQDGEFARRITENLFEKLYDVHFPREFINFRTLQTLVMDALQNSNKFQENIGELSFKINLLPKMFNLGDPDVLDCLSLTYKVKWPLNVILPADTITKYDEVFRFLLKLSRISWVLKKIFLEMKILAKETGKKEVYLMMSPHYRRLHQCRHVMLHFVQAFQNYVLGGVLQSSWEIFERGLTTVTDLDSLYSSHTTYIKNILFLCLLNQKSTPLKKVIDQIFTVILKFYDHLRSRSWTCEDGAYVHPNFAKLESIFFNFEEFVFYLFKIGRKVAKCGYQPHLTQLLDMLDINNYYTRNTV